LFHFTPQDNLITRLHPLVKVTLLGTTAVFAFMVSEVWMLAVYLTVVLAVIALFRIRFGRAIVLVKLFMIGIPMMLGLFVLSYLWREPTYAAGALRGLNEGILYALRFLSLILVNFIIVLSTDPREVYYVFRSLLVPDTISRIMAHVINLFPRLVQEIQAIAEAQTLRGMRWRNLWRPSNWLPLALPVVLATMRYSEQMAISLELRGGMDIPVEARKRLGFIDWLVLAACFTIIALTVRMYRMPAF
jgi:energy-coupling factor transport system permease protein